MKQIESFDLNPEGKLGVRLYDKHKNYFDVNFEFETSVNIETELSIIEKPKASIWEMAKKLLQEKEEPFKCIIENQVDGEFFAFVEYESGEKYNFRVSDLLIMFFFDKKIDILANDDLFTVVNVVKETEEDLQSQLDAALAAEDFEKAKEIQSKIDNK